MIILDFIVIHEICSGQMNAIFPFTVTLFFLSAGKYNIVDSGSNWCGCKHLLRSYSISKFINAILALILMPLATVLSPIYSMVGLFGDKMGPEIWINYHLLSIITGNIMPIVIISMNSSPFIITILCIITAGIGII